MRDQCKSGNPAALYKLGLCGSLDGEEDLSTMAKEQIMDHLDLPAQHDSKKDGCRREKSNDGNLFILDALVPAMQRKQDRQSLYTQILTELKKYSTSNGSYCKARTHDGRRIHYDPDAKGPFGVSHKLQEVMAMSDRLWDIEVLLRPFGHMHKKLLCQRLTKYMLSLVKDFAPRPRFQAVWKYFGDLRERIVPISKSNSQETVRIVVEHTRQRCKDLHPECLLLKKAMNTGSEEVDIYSLHTETEGLGAQIGACFLGPKRSAGQYEELIERRLYTFLVSHPYAVNPRRKIPSQMQDKDVLKAKGGHGMKTRSMKRKASAIVETGSQAMEIASMALQTDDTTTFPHFTMTSEELPRKSHFKRVKTDRDRAANTVHMPFDPPWKQVHQVDDSTHPDLNC